MVNSGKTSATQAARLSGPDRSSFLGLSDPRVRYGIKLSLASLLSLYVALVLRLEHPNWAVLTTLVMMNSHYIGSTALKAILRCVGTIGGALLGIWLVGTYASSPVVFLLLIYCFLEFG